MKKENIEIIIEQLEHIESALDDLKDSFYQIKLCLQDEFKQKIKEK